MQKTVEELHCTIDLVYYYPETGMVGTDSSELKINLEKIHLKDMFWYDDSTFEKFPKIKIKNIIGMNKTVDVKTGYISDLHLP